MRRHPTVAIQGGLGNQLFQWFFAHELKADSKFELYLKRPGFPAVNVIYEFGLVPLIEKCRHFQKQHEYSLDLIPRIFDYLWRIPLLKNPLRILGYFHENPRSGTRAHKSPARRVIYANGYFQNWKYASHQVEAIDSELIPVLKRVFNEVSERFDLAAPYSVIHVRRGDYRADQNPETMIGSLADEYFSKWAIGNPSNRLILLAEHRKDVEDLIATLKPDLVLDNTETSAWETLAILSFADTMLGSNSTLSWWGAWVVAARGGKVFLPSEWDVVGRFNTQDFLFPSCGIVTPIWEKL